MHLTLNSGDQANEFLFVQIARISQRQDKGKQKRVKGKMSEKNTKNFNAYKREEDYCKQ